MMRSRLSLKTKMVAAISLLIAVLMASSALISFSYFRSEFEKTVSREQYALTTNIAEKADGQLIAARNQIEGVARLLAPAVIGGRHRLQTLLGREDHLRDIFDEGMFLISADGGILASVASEKSIFPRGFPCDDVVGRVFRTGITSISSTCRSPRDGHPMVLIAAPLKDGQNRTLAVIAGGMGIGRGNFLGEISHISIGTKGYAYLFDSRRLLILHPDRKRAMHVLPRGANVMFDRAVEGFDGTGKTVTSDGIPMLASFRHLSSTDWILAVNYPLSEAFAPIHHAERWFFIALSAAVLLSMILVMIFMEHLLRPLNAFTRHVADIATASGGAGGYFHSAVGGEIGILADSFNQMVERIERQQNELTEEKEFAQNLVHSSAIPTFVIDSQHKVLAWNRACEEMTGIAEREIVGTALQWKAFYRSQRPTLADLVIDDVDQVPHYYSLFGHSTLIPGSLSAEGWFADVGGQERYMAFEAAPVYRNGILAAAIETLQDLTERKRAEERVAQLKDFYLTLFEEFPALIWRAGLDAECDYFNKTWLEFTGRTIEQETGNGWAEGVHAEDLERCIATYRNAFDNRRPFEMEYRLRHHSGEYRWIVDSGRPYRDPDRNFAGYIGVCYDITERKKVEETLRILNVAVEQSASSIVLTDTDGSIEYVNRKFTQVTGYTSEEVLGGSPSMLKSGERPSEEYAELWKTISAGQEWRGEFHNRKKSGEFYWESASISPIISPDGAITHFLAIKEDITDRKWAEEALVRSRAELVEKHEQLAVLFEQVEAVKREWEQTLDCIGDLVILADHEGHIRRCNRALGDLIDMEYDQVLGRNWKDLINLMTWTSPGPDGGELFHPALQRWFDLKIYPFSGSGGEGSFVVTLHDSTEWKKMTAELELAYNELKLTQSRILQQEKMASIGQLAAGVAHEINNPIGFISSNLGSLGRYIEKLLDYLQAQEEALTATGNGEMLEGLKTLRRRLKLDFVLEDIGQLIEQSLDGAERVRKIVQNLKSFSRVDEAEYMSSDVNECLETTINMVWNELKYVASVTRDYGELPPLTCWPQQLNQVFMNLLVNAAHAIEKQGEIQVRTRYEDEAVLVSVSDTGKGIAPEHINRIFEPFFTTKEVGKGTGLGLSITYDIVKKHHGEITVESEIGKGTTFTIKLPQPKVVTEGGCTDGSPGEA